MFHWNHKTGKRSFHFGIRPKMFLGLLVVFVASAFLLNFILTKQLNESMENRIQADLTKLRNNTEVYVRQIMLLEDRMSDDLDLFIKTTPDLLEQLYATNGYALAFYDSNGYLVSSTAPGFFTQENFPQEAFDRAYQEGVSSYRLRYDTETYCYASFIIPIHLAEETLGYIYYYIDYSALQVENYQTIQTVLHITSIIMAITLLFSVLLLSHFTMPLRRLTSLTSRFKENGVNSHEIQSQKEALAGSLSHRHDEIGDLSHNYFEMLDTIEKQIHHIRRDRNHILQLLNSKQLFFDNVTHELKTPLTTIQGFAQLIQDNGTSDPELLETGLNHILNESARLHTMVLQLLEMSNQKLNYQLQPLNLTPLLTSVAEAMELKANRYQSHLKLTCPQTLIISGQEDRLRQLLINLIDNAIKYGAPHEPIEIAAGRQKRDDSSPFSVYLSVQNGGKGMNEEQMAHIFEPFYRVDKNYSREHGSSGLGLAICRKIAEEHHAEIQVESSPEGMTRFTVWFKEEIYAQSNSDQ